MSAATPMPRTSRSPSRTRSPSPASSIISDTSIADEPTDHIEQPEVLLPVFVQAFTPPPLPQQHPSPEEPPYPLADPKPVHPDGLPFHCYIGTCRAAFAAAGPLALHLRSKHCPWSRIPMEILRNYGLTPCPACRAPYTSASNLSKHKCTFAPAVNTGAPVAPVPATTAAAVPPLAKPQYYSANTAFFATIAPDSPELDHVHGQAIDGLPAASIPLISAVLSSFLAAALREPDSDLPTTAIYGLPRLILAPPPDSSTRKDLVSILRGRVAKLALGGAQALWNSHDWLQTLPATTDFPVPLPLNDPPPVYLNESYVCMWTVVFGRSSDALDLPHRTVGICWYKMREGPRAAVCCRRRVGAC